MPTDITHVVKFTAKERAELVEEERSDEPLGGDEVQGRTLVSLVSAGTEVVGCYAGAHYHIEDSSYPMNTGYAAVFEVEQVGPAVTGLAPGDVAFGACGHRSHQRKTADQVVKVPDGLAPEKAVFARMIKISMPSFVHTRIRPPEKAVITGLGSVGLMAAQLAQGYGYEVIACDPDERRRGMAEEHGIRTVLPAVPVDDPNVKKRVGLGLECSGHEQAALDLCEVLRVRGELFLVGVPWVARTDMTAHRILHSVFYNYVVMQSGWEGRMPGGHEIHSPRHHFEAALRWLEEGRVVIREDACRVASPRDCRQQYQDILHGRLDRLSVIFDWRTLRSEERTARD